MNELNMYREFFDKAKLVFEGINPNGDDLMYQLGLLGGLFSGASIMREACRPIEEPQKHTSEPKKITRKRISDDAVKRMQLLYDNGMPFHKIAETMGCSLASVNRKLEGYKPKLVSEPPKGTIDWIRELVAEGQSIEDISEATGYSESVIRKLGGGDT